MKLKEKLAEIDCERLHTGNYSSDAFSFKQGFLAGFEKAREMAASRIHASFIPKSNPLFGQSNVPQLRQAQLDYDICLRLGEEEVR